MAETTAVPDARGSLTDIHHQAVVLIWRWRNGNRQQ